MPDLSFLTDPEQLKSFIEEAIPFVIKFGIAVLILVVGWMLSKWTNNLLLKACRKAKLDEALSRFLASIGQYIILAATVIAALEQVGIKTTSLLAVFASAGLAVGLAMQGSLASFASGVMILFFRPFTLEDYVTIAGVSGTVKDVGLFSTTLVTPDNHTVIVPNAQVTSMVITNYTRLRVRRAQIQVGVAYGADLAKVQSVLKEAVNSIPSVLKEPAASIYLDGFGASSVDFSVYCFSTTGDWWMMQNDVRKVVYDALNQSGIEIPFNQIVVHQA